MNNRIPILIVAAEPYSVFTEILFKTYKIYKLKKPLVVIASHDLLTSQMRYLNYKVPINIINDKFKSKELSLNKINCINIDFKFSKPFNKISNISLKYNEKSFKLALKLIKKKKFLGLINGPISKKHFLKKKFLGITEYIAKKTNTKKFAMLIYNKKFAVSPITTHVPVNRVSKLITKKKIIDHIKIINRFYKQNLCLNPVIGVTGLNPHCENNFNNSEEQNIIIPAINFFKKTNLRVSGPYPADSLFMKNNIKKFNVIIGMYHDQVLTPIKALHNFDSINITLGLPFIRISPDHGPNENMLGQNKSSPESLISAIRFLENQ